MKDERDYIRDIVTMRSMMERSSKFMSLSALACILVGIYALVASFIVYNIFDSNTHEILTNQGGVANANLNSGKFPHAFLKLVFLALVVLLLAIGTAILLSRKKAFHSGEKSWNPTVRRLLINMAVPLTSGGLLILVLIYKGLLSLVAPFTLLFYGLALFNASKFTYDELKSLGLIEICLGLISSFYVEHGLLFWTLGFGVLHIIYGIYLHIRYER